MDVDVTLPAASAPYSPCVVMKSTDPLQGNAEYDLLQSLPKSQFIVQLVGQPNPVTPVPEWFHQTTYVFLEALSGPSLGEVTSEATKIRRLNQDADPYDKWGGKEIFYGYLYQIALGVKHLHDNGRRKHNDLKWENAMLHKDTKSMPYANAVLIDFGSATRLGYGEDVLNVPITEAYAPPEMWGHENAEKLFNDQERGQPHSDVWMLAAMLWVLEFNEVPAWNVQAPPKIGGSPQQFLHDTWENLIQFDPRTWSAPSYKSHAQSFEDGVLTDPVRQQINKIMRNSLLHKPGDRWSIMQFLDGMQDLLRITIDYYKSVNVMPNSERWPRKDTPFIIGSLENSLKSATRSPDDFRIRPHPAVDLPADITYPFKLASLMLAEQQGGQVKLSKLPGYRIRI